jgi:hypothetical protein
VSSCLFTGCSLQKMEQVAYPFRLGAPNYQTSNATEIVHVYMHEQNHHMIVLVQRLIGENESLRDRV